MSNISVSSNSSKCLLSSNIRQTILCILYISLFSMIGVMIRICLGSFFSFCEENDNESSIRYIISNGVCLTNSRDVVFVDLPANMLGSFLMGLSQSGYVLGLASDLPVACFSSRSWFQKIDVLHIGWRTGLCGSLTTFSSWNTQLVMMLVDDFNGLWMKVLFAYIIGLELAMASYATGQQLAILIHRHTNPYHAKEADKIKGSPESHVHHGELPDFERQYLSSILELEYIDKVREEFPQLLEKLELWKQSTSNHRKPFGPLINDLKEIENILIVRKDKDEVRNDLRDIAEQSGWELKSLEDYVKLRQSASIFCEQSDEHSVKHIALLGIFIASLTATLVCKLPDVRTVANQNLYVYCLAAILGPFGAIIRWLLSKYNGRLQKSNLQWVPIGTLSANFLASIISILIGGLVSRQDIGLSDKSVYILRAVSAGTIGSISTVSTFVAEISKLMVSFPIHLWAHIYAFVTIAFCCAFCSIIYYCLLLPS